MEILHKNFQLKGEHYVLHIKGERVIDVKKMVNSSLIVSCHFKMAY